MEPPKVLTSFQTKILALRINELIRSDFYDFDKVREIANLIPINDQKLHYNDLKLLDRTYFENMGKTLTKESLVNTLEMFKGDREFVNEILDKKIKEIT